jgi:hypothetical protein
MAITPRLAILVPPTLRGVRPPLWKFQMGSAVRGQPITWKAGKRQFVAFASGGGGIAVQIVGSPPLGVIVWTPEI